MKELEGGQVRGTDWPRPREANANAHRRQAGTLMKPTRGVFPAPTNIALGMKAQISSFLKKAVYLEFFCGVSKYLKLAANANILITPQCRQTCGWSGHSPQDFRAPQMEGSVAGTSHLGCCRHGQVRAKECRVQDVVRALMGCPCPSQGSQKYVLMKEAFWGLGFCIFRLR